MAEELLKNTLKEIDKKYGKGTVQTGSDAVVETVSTGLVSFDKIIGRTGIPLGKIIEFYGPESGGKSTLALHVIAEAQKRGKGCAYIDMENSFDKAYATILGVDCDDMLLFVKGKTDLRSGEHALDVAEKLINTGEISIIIIDSVPALTPQADLEGEMTDQSMASLSRLMSKAMGRLPDILEKNNCSIIFINQVRQKVGFVMGNPETTPGGHSLKHHASVRLSVRKGEILTCKKKAIGQIVKIKTHKNKMTAPLQEATARLYWGKGFDLLYDLIDTSIKEGIVEQAGAWIKYKGQQFQGKQAFQEMLKDSPDEIQAIKDQLFSGDTANVPKA